VSEKTKSKKKSLACIHYGFKELEYPKSVCSIKKGENTKLLLDFMMIKEIGPVL